jgi:hypothetical protein
MYQAARDNQTEAVNIVLFDPVKAAQAIQDHINENGDSKRKELINWSQFSKKFFMTFSRVAREGWDQYNVTDFTYWICRKHFKDPMVVENQEFGRTEFKAHRQRLPNDCCESSDGSPAIWLPRAAERFKEKRQGMELGLNQGGKVLKDAKEADVKRLMGIVRDGGGDFDCKYMRETAHALTDGLTGKGKDDEGLAEEKEEEAKAVLVDVAEVAHPLIYAPEEHSPTLYIILLYNAMVYFPIYF